MSAFVDPRLELAVRAALPQDVLAQPLTSLTSLRAADLGIRRLGGIEQLSELRWLDLSGNPLASATELGANTKLIRLELRGTALSTLAGLGGLPELEELDLYASRLVDVAEIAGSPSLRSLDLGLCRVRDLGALATLTRLESLTLGNPTLHIPRRVVYSSPDMANVDLTPIRSLARLRQLRIYGFRLRSLSLFEELVGLEELVLDRCAIDQDLGSLPSLPRVELLSLCGCELRDLRALERFPRLRVLILDEAQVANVEVLARFETLELLSLREASVSRRAVAALDKMPRLAEIRLDDRVIRRGRST